MDLLASALQDAAVAAAIVIALGLALAAATALLVRRSGRVAPAAGETLVVDGVPIHWVDRGEGPPVVYLHGAGGSVYDILLSAGPRLAERFRLVAFDRPGYGYSGAPADLAGAPLVQARLLHAAMRRLRLERSVIVAHSAGVPTALALALEHPHDVAGIVTLGGYFFSARDPDRVIGRVRGVPVVGALLRATIIVPVGMLLARFAVNRLFYPDAADPAYARIAPALVLHPKRQAHAARDVKDLEMGMRELSPRYAEIAQPVVAVHGLADYVVSAAQAVRFAQIVPQTELVLLEEVGHLPHFVRPDEVVAAVERVWLRADRGGAGVESAVDPHVAPSGVARLPA